MAVSQPENRGPPPGFGAARSLPFAHDGHPHIERDTADPVPACRGDPRAASSSSSRSAATRSCPARRSMPGRRPDAAVHELRDGPVQGRADRRREARLHAGRRTTSGCLRVAGKHNDFEEVGRTPRHHTFFEMLGNWSFGDYFKREAIHWAWQFLTRDLGIPGGADRGHRLHHRRHRLRRLEGRDRAAAGAARPLGRLPGRRREELVADGRHRAVRSVLGAPLRPRRAPVRGPATACPTTPSTARAGSRSGTSCSWSSSCIPTARLTPLPAPGVDTGLGLERIASVVQQVPTNYDTTCSRRSTTKMRELLGHDPEAFEQERFSYQVIADHSRAVTFLVADGVTPSNEGRGYVLRRILRRAVRHGRLLGPDGAVPRRDRAGRDRHDVGRVSASRGTARRGPRA